MGSIGKWIYFLLIGWWLGMLWFAVGVIACLTIIGIPIGVPMIFKTPEMMFMGD